MSYTESVQEVSGLNTHANGRQPDCQLLQVKAEKNRLHSACVVIKPSPGYCASSTNDDSSKCVPSGLRSHIPVSNISYYVQYPGILSTSGIAPVDHPSVNKHIRVSSPLCQRGELIAEG